MSDFLDLFLDLFLQVKSILLIDRLISVVSLSNAFLADFG